MQKMLVQLFLVAVIIILPINQLYSKNSLSENATISVLTCSEGDELYSAFGHSAIRVFDKNKNIDFVFNYGTFDFNTPNFYLKFANGKLNYLLSYRRFKSFLPSYFSENRSVIEQELNLSFAEKQQIFDALIENYKPENRYYKYDFFYDNCATRIYDIIANNIEGEIVIKQSKQNEKRTFRNYLHHYLAQSPWIEDGLKILLGLPADKVASPKESTYLPDFLMEVLNNSEIKTDGNKRALVAKSTVLLERDTSIVSETAIVSPALCAWIVLLVVVLCTLLVKNTHWAWNTFDRFLFAICGLVGLLLLYLWLVTDHQVTRNNMNILWSFPTLLLIAIIGWKTNISKVLLWVNLSMIALFIAGWYWIPQDFPMASLPFATIILIRIISRLKPNFFRNRVRV